MVRHMKSDFSATRRDFVTHAMFGVAGAFLMPIRTTAAQQTASSPRIGERRDGILRS
jgi:hypothetical protein